MQMPPITSPSQKDNKAYWIKCLQALDQEDAPDLPRHIPASKLNASELEALVTRAKQRRLKYTAVESLRPTSRVTVPIWFGNWDRALGKSYGFGADVQLLPGGKLLLVLWSEGYLQCLEVPSGMCVWTHPDPGSYSAHGKHGLRVCNFGYDMQEDNVVHILTVRKSQDKYSKESTFEEFRISPGTNAKSLQKYSAPEPKTRREPPLAFVKSSGDITAVYTDYNPFLTLRKDDRTVMIKGPFDAVDMVDDHLICVIDEAGVKSVLAILLSSIRKVLPNVGATTNLVLGDLTHIKCLLPNTPPNWLSSRAQLSVCNFHWKSEAERKLKGINLTVLRDIENNHISVIETYYLETADTSSRSNSMSPLLHPRLTHDGRPQFISLNSNKHYRSTFVKRLSKDGSTVVGYYKKHTRCDPPENMWMLASVSRERTVAHTVAQNVKNVGVEFYSGALYYPTMDAKSVVIEYF